MARLRIVEVNNRIKICYEVEIYIGSSCDGYWEYLSRFDSIEKAEAYVEAKRPPTRKVIKEYE